MAAAKQNPIVIATGDGDVGSTNLVPLTKPIMVTGIRWSGAAAAPSTAYTATITDNAGALKWTARVSSDAQSALCHESTVRFTTVGLIVTVLGAGTLAIYHEKP